MIGSEWDGQYWTNEDDLGSRPNDDEMVGQSPPFRNPNQCQLYINGRRQRCDREYAVAAIEKCYSDIENIDWPEVEADVDPEDYLTFHESECGLDYTKRIFFPNWLFQLIRPEYLRYIPKAWLYKLLSSFLDLGQAFYLVKKWLLI